MPELPEVETTCRGIEPHICGQKISKAIVRQRSLRWPIPRNLNALVSGKTIQSVSRRGKYLLIKVEQDILLMHLGMSGRLRILSADIPPEKHDHLDIVLQNNQALRYTDPRRFGAVLWVKGDPAEHPLLVHLGPEPLKANFDGVYLFEVTRNRKQAIKTLIMDSKVVVGVGNIYANEALFLAGVLPTKKAMELNVKQCNKLVSNIKSVLEKAIQAGGTTLQDFLDPDGKAGYFAQSLLVYGRGGEPCMRCKSPLEEIRLGQRSTVFCLKCQK